MKKKNEKEKVKLATEKKVEDDAKFDELYIDEVGLRCEAKEVKKRVRFDNKVEYISPQREKSSKKTVRFQHNIAVEASTQQDEKRAIQHPDQGTSKVPTSILQMKKTNEKSMKCIIDGQIYPTFTKNTIVGDSATSCHLFGNDEGMEDVVSINKN